MYYETRRRSALPGRPQRVLRSSLLWATRSLHSCVRCCGNGVCQDRSWKPQQLVAFRINDIHDLEVQVCVRLSKLSMSKGLLETEHSRHPSGADYCHHVIWIHIFNQQIPQTIFTLDVLKSQDKTIMKFDKSLNECRIFWHTLVMEMFLTFFWSQIFIRLSEHGAYVRGI